MAVLSLYSIAAEHNSVIVIPSERCFLVTRVYPDFSISSSVKKTRCSINLVSVMLFFKTADTAIILNVLIKGTVLPRDSQNVHRLQY